MIADRLAKYYVSRVGLFGPTEFRALWFLKQYSEFKLRGLFNGWGYHLPRRFQA